MAKLLEFIKRDNIIFWIFLLGLMLFISIKFGASTDEIHQQPYGNQSYKFFKTLGSNDSATYHRDDLINYYGALVDTIPEAINDVFSGNLFIYRHLIITLFSFLYLFYGFKIAHLFGGNKYGYLTLILLLIEPRIIGEAFNNPKDTPFAGTYLMAIYYILKYIQALPNISYRNIIMAALSIGICINVRVGGFLLLFYLGLFLFIWLFFNRDIWNQINSNSELKKQSILYLIYTGIASYVIGILFWPSALKSPISFPIEALGIFSKFPVTIKTLFEGKWISSTELPNLYLIKYMFISNPEIIFIGLLLGIIAWKFFDKNQRLWIVFLVFASIFPIVYTIYKKAAFYNGWRQMYFSFTPLIIVSGIFWSKLIFEFKTKNVRYIFILIFSIFIFLPVSFMCRNFPQFYVYFNSLSGGIDKNYGKYEMDYYGHGVNEATFWINKNHPEWFTDSTYRVVSNVPYNMNRITDRWNIKKQFGYVRFRERFDTDWEIGVFSPAFVDPAIIQNNIFKSKNVIHSIDIDGKPICIIVERKDKNDFYAKRLIDSGKFTEAIPFLNKALQYDPNNEIAWANLALAQLQTNQANLAIESANKCLSISPESIAAQNYLGYAYLQSGNASNAQYVFLQMIEQNPGMPEPYRVLAQIYQQQGNAQAAQQYMSAYQQITGGR